MRSPTHCAELIAARAESPQRENRASDCRGSEHRPFCGGPRQMCYVHTDPDASLQVWPVNS